MALMLHESADPVIRDTQPEIKTGKKWSARTAVDEAEANLRTKEIVGATQHDRAGLGSRPQQWFSQQSGRGRREMILYEMHQLKEEEIFIRIGCGQGETRSLDPMGAGRATQNFLARPCQDGTTSYLFPAQSHL